MRDLKLMKGIVQYEIMIRRTCGSVRSSLLAPAILVTGWSEAAGTMYLRAGVTLLRDVRRNPLSRKYGFSKSTLSKGCEGVGIRYEHLPELGIASEERRELHTQADYDALFAVYERDSLPKQGQALAKISVWMAEGYRVALTCYEAEPCQCHRHCVAEVLERELGSKFSPQHL